MQVLEERKAAVLRAVVQDYIRTAEPVGSGTIARRYRLGVSSATIRNELAALEDLGYLVQPHTSAGRIPTDFGYRFYVDCLPRRLVLSRAHRRALAAFFEEAPADVEEVLHGTALLLSRLTGYAALAVAPRPARSRVLRAELVMVGPVAMLLVVGDTGRVDKHVLEVGEEPRPEAVERVSATLVERFEGLTYGGAAERAAGLAAASAEPAERALLEAVAAGFRRLREDPGSEHVFVGGVANLADEESFSGPDAVRGMVAALEEPEALLGILDWPRWPMDPGEVTVRIGHENPVEALREASVVVAWYWGPTGPTGAVAVVGPTRMAYPAAMSATQVVAGRLSALMESLAG